MLPAKRSPLSRFGEGRKNTTTRENAHFSVKVRFSNQTMMGKFFRSLYVGRMTEYLSLEAFAGAIFCSDRIGASSKRKCSKECASKQMNAQCEKKRQKKKKTEKGLGKRMG
jgi:hypothetical protein